MKRIDHHNLFEDDFDDWERIEKIRPKSGQKKRKKGDEDQKKEFVVAEDRWPEFGIEDGFRARVVEVHKRYAFVSPEPEPKKIKTREVYLATVAKRYLQNLKSERNFIVVGDVVLCKPISSQSTGITTDIPQAVIELAAPREKSIARPDPHKQTMAHVLAANVDQLIIVASYLAPKIRWGLVDRYLALADAQDLQVCVVLTKSDLFAESDDLELRELCLRRQEILTQIGVPWMTLSANRKDKTNFKERQLLETWLADKISVFSGHSGVGKSSLVNLFGPELVQLVEPDEDIFYKGRHTTSFASLIKLARSGYVIDSPGIRSFLVEADTPSELLQGFREMKQLDGKCKFSKCQHIEEEGCAIKAAVEGGKIAPERYASYRNIWLGESGREGLQDREEFRMLQKLEEE